MDVIPHALIHSYWAKHATAATIFNIGGRLCHLLSNFPRSRQDLNDVSFREKDNYVTAPVRTTAAELVHVQNGNS